MKTIIEKIWKFINSKFFVWGLAILLIMVIGGQCQRTNDFKREIKKNEQNIAAADSTIREYVDKEGRWNAEKSVWILTEKELKKQNEDLFKEVKKQEGKVTSLNNVVLGLRQDISILHDSIGELLEIITHPPVPLGNNRWKLPWELNYDWDDKNFDYYKGHTIIKVDSNDLSVEHETTLLDERNSNINLIFGEKVVDGQLNVFVTSKYPGLTAESMKGYFLDPNKNKNIKSLIEKDHWFTGFSISVGITPTWDFIEKRPTVLVGPTIGYTIYQW